MLWLIPGSRALLMLWAALTMVPEATGSSCLFWLDAEVCWSAELGSAWLYCTYIDLCYYMLMFGFSLSD